MSDAAVLALQHARRPAHPRVPARGLRRCRGARRGTRPSAPSRSRGRGALLRRPARRAGTFGYPMPAEFDAAQPGARHAGRRPADGRGCRGRRPRALAHLVRELRRASRRSCCTASRTSSPRTASSRCVRGRPSSSAAATGVSQLDRAHRVRGRRRRDRRERRHAPRHPAGPIRRSIPTRVEVVHNGIDLERLEAASTMPDLVRVARHRPRPPVGGLRRPDHAAEGPAVPAPRGAPAAARRAARALRGRARHRRRSWPRCTGLVAELQAERGGVVWIDRQLLAQHELAALLTAATTFVCPSVYEPLGIVNLEAMACGAPVVGTATGGIPEVVDDGVTGRPRADRAGRRRHRHPARPRRVRRRPRRGPHARSSATRRAPARWGRRAGARRGRDFAWDAIAARTREIYERVLAG